MGGGYGEMVGIPGTQVFTNQPPPPPYSDAFTLKQKRSLGSGHVWLWLNTLYTITVGRRSESLTHTALGGS